MEKTKVRVKYQKPENPDNPFFDGEIALPSFFHEPATGNLYGLALSIDENQQDCYVHNSCLKQGDESIVIVNKCPYLKEEFYVFHHSDDGSGLNKIDADRFTELFNQNFNLEL